jgi:hypothetical protein
MLEDECSACGCNGSACSGCQGSDPSEDLDMEEIDKMFAWWEKEGI